jgi:hypothetical protein
MPVIELPGLARYRFDLSAIESLSLPQYTGSAWRGLLGHGLRRSACAIAADHCNACLLQSNCVYFQVFESRASDNRKGGPRHLPHPFVLSVTERRRRIAAGDRLALEINLFGTANDRLPFIIQAMIQAGQLGIGSPRGRFIIATVSQEQLLGENDWRPIYDSTQGVLQALPLTVAQVPPPPEAIDIELLTPLRSKRKGHLLGPREFQAGDLLRQLWRRVHELAAAYDSTPEKLSLSAPRSRADCFDADSRVQLRWSDWTRYSSRQHTRMQMGGVVGKLQLRGARDDLAQWWPLLWVGQWLHLGKATSMGLGHYRLLPAQTCTPDRMAVTESL